MTDDLDPAAIFLGVMREWGIRLEPAVEADLREAFEERLCEAADEIECRAFEGFELVRRQD